MFLQATEQLLKGITKEFLVRWMPLLVLLLLVIFFTLVEPRFFSVRNFARISIASAPALMIAVGVTFIIIMGSIDLSMEGAVSMIAVIFAYTFLAWGGDLASIAFFALPLSLLIGAAFGLVNGLVHVKMKVPSFMSSLAMGFVATGFALLLTGGDRIRIEDPLFRSLLTERIFAFPLMFYVAVVFLLIAWFIQTKTALGRHFYAVGGGEELAHFSGLNVAKIRILGFTLAGMFYAVGALLIVGRIGIAETISGSNLMFVSITSVVVGGTALWGGVGGVWNSLVGVLIVNIINNGMIVIGMPSYLQEGVLGVLVIVAVVLSSNRKNTNFVK